MAYKAIIAGASGLVGSSLLNILLQQPEYNEVVVLVRKELPLSHKKLVQAIVDFDRLDQYQHIINGHALFCCLGTTRHKTPDMADYRRVEFDYPVQLAKLALDNQVIQYHLVSSMGANVNASSFMYYTKLKGEVEQAIEHIALPCLQIYRPSLLTGERNENRPEERVATGIMKLVDPLLIGPLKRYKSIPAQTVAMAMYKQSLQSKEGVFIHPSDHIKQLA